MPKSSPITRWLETAPPAFFSAYCIAAAFGTYFCMYAFRKPYTVAVFRRDAFDEVVEKGRWVFGRKADGYVALYSKEPAVWTAEGVLKGEGLIAQGRKNVWICQLGRKSVDGPFETWTKAISAARLDCEGLNVTYDAPGVGTAAFGWEGPLTVDGTSIPLGDYPRFGNPYCTSDFESAEYVISSSGRTLTLDFKKGIRSAE